MAISQTSRRPSYADCTHGTTCDIDRSIYSERISKGGGASGNRRSSYETRWSTIVDSIDLQGSCTVAAETWGTRNTDLSNISSRCNEDPYCAPLYAAAMHPHHRSVREREPIAAITRGRATRDEEGTSTQVESVACAALGYATRVGDASRRNSA